MTIIAATGHRPNKLGGFKEDVDDALYILACNELETRKPEVVITGMALGWDQAIASAALSLNIPYWAVVPFTEQHKEWPRPAREKYRDLLTCAQEVFDIGGSGFAGWKYHARNRAMVDNCDLLLALWDGSNGGTKSCIDYAMQQGTLFVNVWDTYQAKFHSLLLDDDIPF